jgi:glutamate/tyrosine decarboxylase-like PLP-dependent enzyme
MGQHVCPLELNPLRESRLRSTRNPRGSRASGERLPSRLSSVNIDENNGLCRSCPRAAPIRSAQFLGWSVSPFCPGYSLNLSIDDVMPALNELVREHLARERETPVRKPLQPEDLIGELDLTLSEDGLPLDVVVQRLREILAVTPATATPRFFNQLFGGRDGAAVLGEMLATLLNNSMYTYKVAGVHVLLELELVQRMGAMLGFTDPEGAFTPGGSISNLCGMQVARNEALQSTNDCGLTGRKLRVYTSEDCHYSVRKAAALLGIGRNNVIKIAVDARGRMLPDALRAAIHADRAAGHLPMMINATAGTTVLGAFDPLVPLADIAESEGLWLHVDAAYGGSMLFNPEFASHFEGVERADSVTWDAHKMMGVPLTCSVVIVRHKGMLTKHFNETASYLFQDDSDDMNPGTRSIQCGRRNDALKLWTAWKTHGDAGYRHRMEKLRSLTLHARAGVVARSDMSLVREPESINLCFSVHGVQEDRLCTVLNEQGRVMVGHAIVDGAPVIRAVFLDPTVSNADVETLLDEIEIVAAELRRRTAAA